MINTKKDFFVANLSGGKDSSCMVLKLLEEKYPVDLILFCDTQLEFFEMYNHLDKFEQYIKRYTDIGITRIKPEKPFEYYFLEHEIHHRKNSAYNEKFGATHKGYGWAGPKMRWCTNRLKTQTRERFLRELRKKYNVIEYVGIAADEQYRLERKNNQRENCRHPLVEWGMTESDCLKYCYDRGFDWGGLYEKFSRVSCWCCPLQPLSELRILYNEFPDLWEQLKKWDNQTFRKFRADYSVIELEKRFKLEDEWQSAGRTPKGKAFFNALKERLGVYDEKINIRQSV